MRFLSIVLLVAAMVLTTTTATQARRDRRKAAKLNSLYQAGYGAPPPPVYHTTPTPSTTAAPHVDLHNKEFCVDVSAYQPVQWVEREDQECDTIFVKKCDWKKEVIIKIHQTVKSLLDNQYTPAQCTML